jgi:hypothetical protein
VEGDFENLAAEGIVEIAHQGKGTALPGQTAGETKRQNRGELTL